MDNALRHVLDTLTRNDLERTQAACRRDGDRELAGLLSTEIDRRTAPPRRRDD